LGNAQRLNTNILGLQLGAGDACKTGQMKAKIGDESRQTQKILKADPQG
jgi:hypothetical protein